MLAIFERRWISTFLLALMLGCLAPIGDGLSATQPRLGVKVAELKDQLEKGLRARRPVEFTFIGKVVDLVTEGKLPLNLVNGTFEYARRKNRKRPYPHFERALKLRAAKIGVTIE